VAELACAVKAHGGGGNPLLTWGPRRPTRGGPPTVRACISRGSRRWGPVRKVAAGTDGGGAVEQRKEKGRSGKKQTNRFLS
jgi:hypothetical protein